jgi:hypothetical protein
MRKGPDPVRKQRVEELCGRALIVVSMIRDKRDR